MAPDPSVLGSNIVLGPLALLGFIVAAVGYAAREYRKAREQHVEDLKAEAERLEEERDEARAERNAANRRVDAKNAEILQLKEKHMLATNVEHARLVKAREMLVERGVLPEDLP